MTTTLFGNLVEIAVQLIDNDNLLSIHAFDRRNKRTGACGDDEGIRCFFLDVLRCYLVLKRISTPAFLAKRS